MGALVTAAAIASPVIRGIEALIPAIKLAIHAAKAASPTDGTGATVRKPAVLAFLQSVNSALFKDGAHPSDQQLGDAIDTLHAEMKVNGELAAPPAAAAGPRVLIEVQGPIKVWNQQ